MFLLPLLKNYFLINLTLCNTSSYFVDLIMCENWGLNWRGFHPEKIHFFFFFLSQKVLSISRPLSDSLAHHMRLFHLPSFSSSRQSLYWKFLRNSIPSVLIDSSSGFRVTSFPLEVYFCLHNSILQQIPILSKVYPLFHTDKVLSIPAVLEAKLNFLWLSE